MRDYGVLPVPALQGMADGYYNLFLICLSCYGSKEVEFHSFMNPWGFVALIKATFDRIFQHLEIGGNRDSVR